MNELLSKISSYNIFNYLFPGAVVIVAAQRMGILTLSGLDLVTLLLIYYSAGLTVSRVGSLILEPLLKWTKFIKYSDYSKYLMACERDKKIEVLVEQSNTYRTIAGGVLCLLAAWPIRWLADLIGLSSGAATLIALGGVLALFLLSYRKQSNYIAQRVEHHSAMAPLVLSD